MGYTYNRVITEERIKLNPITKTEIEDAYKTLYVGKPIKVIDRRGNPASQNSRVIQDEVEFFTMFLVKLKSGNSYTMAEYCIYRRRGEYPFGYAIPMDERKRENETI